MTTYYHDQYSILCPVTGEVRPRHEAGRWDIWTDHDRPGIFNACPCCSDTAPGSLYELNKQRKRAAQR
jgi:hypothetical protein